MLKTANDSPADAPARTPAPDGTIDHPNPVDPRKGTGILPMPAQTETVAGMPRRGRAIEEPGDPGVITPEDDVLDTSYENRKG